MDADAGPYRGPHYYRIQDRALFHGRRADIEPLLAVILGNQVSVLHAPSGAGKSSLLRAALIPTMEARRQTVALCRPGEHPVAAVRAAVTNALLPSAEAESAALTRICDQLGDGGDGRRLSMVAVKQAYRKLQPHSGAYRELVDGIALPENSPLRVLGAPTDTMPSVSRFLYLQKGAEVLIRHLARLELAMGRDDGVWSSAATHGGAEMDDLLERTTVAELVAFFDDPYLREWQADTVQTLTSGRATLAEFFAHLVRQCSNRVVPLEMTVIVDQFEELFTLFGASTAATGHAEHGPSAAGLRDYGHRVELFEQFGELASMRRPGLDGMSTKLPVRIVVSLRDDYIARLDELEAHVGTLEARSRYHLTVLRPEVAAEVIRMPARAYGYDYQDDVFDLIRDRLTEEGDKIAPGHVQIVCERLWRQFGRDMFETTLRGLPKGSSMIVADLAKLSDVPHISMTQLDEMGGIRGILDSHFLEFLANYPDERDRVGILDLLAPLITARHTRNIVMREEVVGRRFVDENVCASLLGEMQRQNIVRIEKHRSGEYVEVSHEFLIEPIEKEAARVKQANELWGALRRAFQRLEVVERAGFRSLAEPLRPDEMQALYWFRDRLDLHKEDPRGRSDAWVAELCLRVCICDLSIADPSREQMFDYWWKYVDDSPVEVDAATVLDELRERATESRWLDHVELAEIADTVADQALDAVQEHFLLGSLIRNASDELAARVARTLAAE